MLWNIGADRGLGSRGFCGMWNEIKNDPCGLLMLTEGGEEKQKAKHSLSNHSLFPSFVKSSPFSRSRARQHRLRASWPCFPLCCIRCVWCVFQDDVHSLWCSPSRQNVCFSDTLHAVSCKNRTCVWTVVCWRVEGSESSQEKTFSFQTAAALNMWLLLLLFFFAFYEPSRQDMNVECDKEVLNKYVRRRTNNLKMSVYGVL